MGFFDSITELFESAAPWTTVEAEAVRGGQGTEPTPARPSGDDDEGEAKVCTECISCFFLGTPHAKLHLPSLF